RAAALIGRESGVIRGYAMTAPLQNRRERVDVAPADAVDDAGLAAMTAEDFLDLRHFIAARNDAIGEIGPVEAADELHVIAKSELFGDVTPYALRSCRGKGVQRCVRKKTAQVAELPILRTEVVTPLRSEERRGGKGW